MIKINIFDNVSTTKVVKITSIGCYIVFASIIAGCNNNFVSTNGMNNDLYDNKQNLYEETTIAELPTYYSNKPDYKFLLKKDFSNPQNGLVNPSFLHVSILNEIFPYNFASFHLNEFESNGACYLLLPKGKEENLFFMLLIKNASKCDLEFINKYKSYELSLKYMEDAISSYINQYQNVLNNNETIYNPYIKTLIDIFEPIRKKIELVGIEKAIERLLIIINPELSDYSIFSVANGDKFLLKKNFNKLFLEKRESRENVLCSCQLI